MTSLKTSIKTITYLSDIGCLEILGASLSSAYGLSDDVTSSMVAKPYQSFLFEFT
ncbi:hypothetical protein FORC43_p119 (plasmid) [Escherichia coli]|uniref:Uncharacterized protein n=4 Tax=Escherichia coli TaxID=562 RepID=A0A9P1K218_ECOLX|nr:hypothetical protein FORC29_p035 [Escherichia coli]ATI10951.1 hypothetical protein FORC43_p119 [Escherichia coli]CCE21224.1 hypothetical protein HUS41_pII0074 [Escherichia coli]